jgi:hypothetical protein
VVNTIRGALNVCAVKAPGFGDRRKAMLEDIAILTGGTVVAEETGRKLESAGDVLNIRRSTRQSRLEELLASNDEWLRLSAAVAVGAWKLDNLGPRVRDLLSSGHAVARETALYVLQQLHHPEELRDVIEVLRQDPAATVRRYAEFVARSVA